MSSLMENWTTAEMITAAVAGAMTLALFALMRPLSVPLGSSGLGPRSRGGGPVGGGNADLFDMFAANRTLITFIFLFLNHPRALN